jgi:hypothetical protein
MGAGKKPVTTKARIPGCYKYDVGAFRGSLWNERRQQAGINHSSLTY